MTVTLPPRPIASGRTAEIYAWRDGWALKLFRPGFSSPGMVDTELRVARALARVGVPTPAVGEVVEIDGRLGIEYERVDGPSMLSVIQARPWTGFGMARQMAALHALIHGQQAPDLPPAHRYFIGLIESAPRLPDGARRAALAQLNALPPGAALCHGDFHPDNIILSPRGPVVLDWTNAYQGRPLADVARTWVMFRFAPPALGIMGRMERPFRRLLLAVYLRRYFALRREDPAELDQWQTVVAAARLHERIEGEAEPLLRFIAGRVG